LDRIDEFHVRLGEVAAAAKLSARLLAGASPMLKLRKHSPTNAAA
jgi:hypothetical protein